MERGKSKYYIGLDVGTNSVGWAVTDENYEILKCNRKSMWGIHLFDEGSTAADRRVHRCARRRLERRKQRIALLRELFSEEICKIDSLFFERLDESRLHEDDRTTKQTNSLFNDLGFKDADLHKKYPTIYHLRKDLCTTKGKPDVRLVYLAAHHIIKYRGHFLFEGIGKGDIPQFDALFDELMEVSAEYGLEFGSRSQNADIQAAMTDKKTGLRDKKIALKKHLSSDSVAEVAFSDLIAGSTVSAEKLFDDADLKNVKLTLGNDFEDKEDDYEDAIGQERMYLVRLMKQIYDWSVLSKLLEGSDSISEAKIKKYEEHRKDLERVKKLVKKYAPTEYYNAFRSKDVPGNYYSYVKGGDGAKKTNRVGTQEDLCKYLGKILKDQPIDADIKQKLEDHTLLPKQRTKDNSLIPYILHYKELEKILDNVSVHLPFLEEKDEYGMTIKEKILRLQRFRIPYYVGPLDDRSERAWLIRKSKDNITPWNFDKVVDVDRSAVAFIDRLTNFCTYLIGEKVVPKNSLLYSRFMLYNELNTLAINGERISYKHKMMIVKDLFEDNAESKKITKRVLEDYLKNKSIISDGDEVTGVDKDIKSNLRPYVQLKAIIGDKVKEQDRVEEIIRIITIFGDDRQRLKKKLGETVGGWASDDEIIKLSGLRFEGWGRFSKKFLTGIYHKDKATGESMCIMTALERTDQNLMELLSERFTYMEQINKINEELLSGGTSGISYDIVRKQPMSPAVRRGVWRTIRIVQDIVKAMRCPPEKIFIETTREKQESKRTTSRKGQLTELFKAIDAQERDWIGEIEGTEEGRFRSRRLWLYYMQHGKCMYCGKGIDLNELYNENVCDKDHIYPRSKIIDDSMNNLVLVHRDCNAYKSDRYPVPAEWQRNMKEYWKYLKAGGFITSEKYERLTRKAEFTDDELNSFINRQLVETSQSVKAIRNTLGSIFKDVDIVSVKGKRVTEFRNEFKFVKCREVNDLHHAKDAYLNIVVGNVYDQKFTKNPNLVKNREKYNLSKVFEYNVTRNGLNAWNAGPEGTISTVNKHMRRNNILFTRFQTERSGAFYNETIQPRGKDLYSLKKDLPTDEYGGYTGINPAYFILVEHNKGKKTERTLESIPVYIASNTPDEPTIIKYLEEKGLREPRIVIPKIKMKSLFEIDGFRLNISGDSDFTCAVQLILSDEHYSYCKEISKCVEMTRENKTLKWNDFRLSSEKNLELYDEFVKKFSSAYETPFFETPRSQLISARDIFSVKEVGEQAKVLFEVLKMFHCNPARADLKIIGCKATGRILITNPTKRDIKLIYQSPTGLFEKEVNLRKI